MLTRVSGTPPKVLMHGEFQFDLDPRPDLRLEIAVRENHWPDPMGASTQ